MKPRVIEAVGSIGRLIREREELLLQSDELFYELSNLGFQDREIRSALRWIEKNTLGDLREKTLKDYPEPAVPMRVLSPVERARVGARGHNFLMKLYKKGILDNYLLEEIFERLRSSEEEVFTTAELRQFVSLSVFSRVQDEWKEFLSRTNTLLH